MISLPYSSQRAIILIAFLFCFSAAFGQRNILRGQQANKKIPGSDEVVVDHQSSPRFIKFRQGVTRNTSKDPEELLGISDGSGMKLKNQMKDGSGREHFRYVQTYDGIEVMGAEYIFHYEGEKMLSANGRVLLDLNINTKPTLTKQQALDIALAEVDADSYMWESKENEAFIKHETNDNAASFSPEGKLLISSKRYDVSQPKVLVYQFDIYAKAPLGRYNVEVDAHSGEIINLYNKLHHATTSGTGESLYDGTVNVSVDFDGTNYYLSENSRGDGIHTYDLHNGTDYFSATLFTESDSYFNETSSQTGVSAHFGAGATYDYFYDNFGRNSFDGSGAAINSYVHYSTDYFNAFWDGSRMTYGDGDGVTASALVSLDIVGHEITHAVTQYSAGLVYSYESGALNESFSDIFGQSVEFETFPATASWNLADQIYFDGVSMIRSMDNPNSQGQPDTYLGDYWYSGSGDNGGVHYNSGVQNFWFYLLVDGGTGTNDNGYGYNVASIGLEAAQQIAYRNLTVYLTSTSEYVDARAGAEQAAIDLYGAGSAEHLAVVEAWNAVGVPSAEPLLSVSDTLNFGNIPMGLPAQEILALTNQGTGLLFIYDIESNNSLFTIADTSFSVGELESYNLGITFTPTQPGDTSALISLYTNVDTALVTLMGTGVEPPELVFFPDSLTDSLYTGDSSVYIVTINNSGSSDLIFDLTIEEDADEPLTSIDLNAYKAAKAKRSSFTYPDLTSKTASARPQYKTSMGSALGGRLFAANYTDNSIIEFDPADGSVINSFNSPDNLGGPDGLAYDGEYLYLISAFGTSTIYRINPETGLVVDTSDISGLTSVDGLGHSGKNLYATDYSTGVIYVIDFDDEVVTEAIDIGIAVGGGISFGGSRDAIFVADFSKIYELDASTYEIINESPSLGQIYGVAYSDMLGLLFIADISSQLIKVYDPDGWVLENSFSTSTIFALAGDEVTGSKWVSTNTGSGTVAPGDSQNIEVHFNAANLYGGEYKANILLSTNDPSNQLAQIPVLLVVTGAPVATLNTDTLSFGNTYIGASRVLTLDIVNEGTDDLTVELTLADSSFSVDTMSLVVSSQSIYELDVAFSPDSAGNFSSELLLVTNDLDNDSLIVKLFGTGIEPPVIDVSPDSLGVALYTGDSSVQVITIDNLTGGSDLIWEADISFELEESALYLAGKHLVTYGQQEAGGNNHGLAKISPISMETINTLQGTKGILAWVTYADMSREYPNTMNAISQYFTDFHVATTSTSDAGQLEAMLDTTDVFLIPEQEGGSSALFRDLGLAWQEVLFSFVNGGGTIILCGSGGSANELLNAGGLMMMAGGESVYGTTLTVLDTTHYLTSGVSPPVTAQNATFTVDLTDSAATALVNYNTYTAVGVKEIGKGFVAYLGYDFYDYDDNAARMIANAVANASDSEDWLSLEMSSDTIPAGASQTLDVLFNASELYGGLYTAQISLISNDPLSPEILIPVGMEVTGVPVKEISQDSLLFDRIFLSFKDSLTFTVANQGTDDLELSLLFSDSTFTANASEVNIAPEDEHEFTVYFAPEVAAVYEAELLLVSNELENDSTLINLRGEGIEPPVLQVFPDSVNEALNSGETSAQTLVIDNSAGGSELTYSIAVVQKEDPGAGILDHKSFYGGPALEDDIFKTSLTGTPETYQFANKGNVSTFTGSSVDLEEVLDALDTGYLQITGLIPDQYYFSEGETGTSISDGGGDMYDGGNLLSTNLGGNLSYTNGVMISSSYFGNGPYFTAKYPGLFVLGADLSSVNSFMINGNLGADDGGYADGSVLTLTKDGRTFYGFVKRVYDAGDPSVNHLIIVEENASLSHSFSTSTNDDYHQVDGLDNNDRLYYLLYAGSSGAYINDTVTLEIMDKFLDVIGEGASWLTVEPMAGEVPPGETANVQVNFDATELYGGLYELELVVTGNDPYTSHKVVPVSMQVTGVPYITVSEDTVDFGTLFVGASASRSITISNEGTDSLVVTAITSENDAFALDRTGLTLAPQESAAVQLSYNPAVSGNDNTQLWIHSNAPGDSVAVQMLAEAVDPPVMTITPDSLNESLYTGQQQTQMLNIDNSEGGSDLNWSMDIGALSFSSTHRTPVGFYASEPPADQLRAELPVVGNNTGYSGSLIPESLDTLANFPTTTTGMVIVGDTLYAVSWSNSSLVKYHLGSRTVVESISIHHAPYGITYANGLLWIGDNSRVARGYNLSGTLTGSFNLPFSDYPSLAFNGEYFIVSRILSGSSVYLVDFDGSVIDTFDGSINYAFELDWAADRLWCLTIIGASNAILSMTLEDGALQPQDTVLFHDIFNDTYGVAHDGDNLYWSTWDGLALVLDDGLESTPEWLTSNVHSGTIPAGESMDAAITFDASGLAGGTYHSMVTISGNDPETPDKIIPVTLEVTDAPDIAFDASALEFGEVFVGDSVTLSLTIQNEGTAVLQIESVSSDHGSFTVSDSPGGILPGENLELIVQYAPSADAIDTGSLSISSNDPDQPTSVITLIGTGILPPVIEVMPAVVSKHVVIGESISQVITISNTGSHELIFTASSDDLWVTLDVDADTVPAGSASDVSVLLSSTQLEPGLYTSSISIVSNDPLNPEVNVPVALRVSGIPDIELSADSIFFGEIDVATIVTGFINISNQGTDTLNVNAVSDNGAFTFTNKNLMIPAGDSMDLHISFSPATPGIHTGEITIFSNDPNEASIRLFVSGAGAAPDSIANRAPVMEDQSFEIFENSPQGQFIGQLMALDPDGDALTFSILSGNEEGVFGLTPVGELTLVDSGKFDHELHSSFGLRVLVSDGADSDTAAVLVYVKDVDESVNHAPVIEDQTFSLEENVQTGTVVGTVLSSDADDDRVTYSIISGNSQGTFTLDALTGVISVHDSTALDYELNKVISFIIQVSDSQDSDVAIVSVELVDVNETDAVLGLDVSGGLRVFPNPATGGAVTVENDVAIYSIELLDHTGRVVRTASIIYGNTANIDLDGLSAGVYYLILRDAAGKETSKLIVR